jgi:Outer membrane protein beta-barrel domain
MIRILLAMVLLPLGSYAQWQLSFYGGTTGYQGDMQSKRFTVDQAHLGVGVGIGYRLSPHWSLRSGIQYGKIAGDDRNNEPLLQARNLSFQSNIIEGNLLLEYSFLNLSKHLISPYVFAGAAVFHHNPFAFDTLGTKIKLRPLSTEGQGLPQYPDRTPYQQTQFAIPFGGGVRMRVADNITIGYEIGLRKTFTDYLDDLSTTYIDPAILLQERGPKAVEMAFRGGELKNSNAQYPAAGSIRGGAKFKDWYYFQGITITVALYSRSKDRKRGAVDCPRDF